MIVFLRLTQSGLIDSGHLDSSRAHLAPQVAPIWTYRDIQNIRQIVAIAIQPGDAGPSFQTRPQVIDPAERNGIRRLPMTQTLNGTAGDNTLIGTQVGDPLNPDCIASGESSSHVIASSSDRRFSRSTPCSP